MLEGLSTIAEAVHAAHTDPDEYEYHGVPVVYEDDSFFDSTWDEWKEVLDEWMPRFEEAGWLDDLQGIEIGDSFIKGNAGGQYHHKDMTIAFPQDPDYTGPPYLVGETKEYALIHEMAHHVHIRDMFNLPASELDMVDLNMKQHSLGFHRKCALFEDEVSEYASSNYLEAVAETCAGIMIGNRYPVRVRRAYKKLQGPTPLCNWSEPPERNRGSSNSKEIIRFDTLK